MKNIKLIAACSFMLSSPMMSAMEQQNTSKWGKPEIVPFRTKSQQKAESQQEMLSRINEIAKLSLRTDCIKEETAKLKSKLDKELESAKWFLNMSFFRFYSKEMIQKLFVDREKTAKKMFDGYIKENKSSRYFKWRDGENKEFDLSLENKMDKISNFSVATQDNLKKYKRLQSACNIQKMHEQNVDEAALNRVKAYANLDIGIRIKTSMRFAACATWAFSIAVVTVAALVCRRLAQ